MIRFARSLLMLCSAASLLLCVAMCVLWVRSYRFPDQLVYRYAGGYRTIGSASGDIVVQLNPDDTSGFSAVHYGWEYLRVQPYTAPRYAVAFGNLGPVRTFSTWELGGAGWYTVRDTTARRTVTGVVPFFLLVAATAALPLGWTFLRLRSVLRKRRDQRVGRCHHCGYDLRASPERCPECGTLAAPRQMAA